MEELKWYDYWLYSGRLGEDEMWSYGCRPNLVLAYTFWVQWNVENSLLESSRDDPSHDEASTRSSVPSLLPTDKIEQYPRQHPPPGLWGQKCPSPGETKKQTRTARDFMINKSYLNCMELFCFEENWTDKFRSNLELRSLRRIWICSSP